MNSIAQSDNHVPCGYMGMLGCNGYEQIDGIICLIANGDNNFLNEGIVEGSILFIDTKSKFQQGLLNVFKFKSNISPQCLGRMVINVTTNLTMVRQVNEEKREPMIPDIATNQ